MDQTDVSNNLIVRYNFKVNYKIIDIVGMVVVGVARLPVCGASANGFQRALGVFCKSA